MILLKQTTLVVLMTLWILLPAVYTQQGIRCYACNPCKNSKDLGDLIACGDQPLCYTGERLENGVKAPIRGCATYDWVENFYCHQFESLPGSRISYKVCHCKTDRCNFAGIGAPSPNGASSFFSSQLLVIQVLLVLGFLIKVNV